MQIPNPPDWLHEWPGVIAPLVGLVVSAYVFWRWLIAKPIEKSIKSCAESIAALRAELETLKKQFAEHNYEIRTWVDAIRGQIMTAEHNIEKMKGSLDRIEQDQQEAKVDRKEMNDKLDDVRNRVIAVEGDVKHLLKESK